MYVEVVELLCAVPQMILEILSHLVAVLSGTKLSEFGTRPSLLAPPDLSPARTQGLMLDCSEEALECVMER